MSSIRILSEHLANQIAAGEVVERPASIVKELLENSLDAHSTRISIKIKGNGTRFIQIIDNGDGMDSDDVMLSIERHATSKLKNTQQLEAIETLGFRGEALPSIGSVSNLTIISRPHNQSTGTKVEVRFGRLQGIHESGCSKGTVIEVHNLFGNVPARRKFLKSARTELFHIEEVVRDLALAHPEVQFTLQIENKVVLDFSVEDIEQRVRDVFQYKEPLLPLLSKVEEQLQISGFLLLPEKTSSTVKNRLRIIVNGRPVQNNMVRSAVKDGLHTLLMKGRQPAGTLYIELAADQIDVNVHPAKLQIRFRNIAKMQEAIFKATAMVVKNYHEQIRATLFTEKEASDKDKSGERPAGPVSFRNDNNTEFKGIFQSLSGKANRGIFSVEEEKPIPYKLRQTQKDLKSRVDVEKKSIKSDKGFTIIGQLFQLYLLCEKNDSFVVIDQHAAHERLLYQEFLTGYLRKKVPAQHLMFPAMVELKPDEVEIIERDNETISALGLELEHFGDTSWVVKSVPALISHVDPADILLDILVALKTPGQDKQVGVVPDRIDKLIASMACKAAVKAGNRLAPEEMIALLERMESSEFFSHCPHGRPVIAIFSKRDIEKWFLRQ